MATPSHTQGLYQHSTTTTPGNDTQHGAEADKIQANLFFDGTLNNYFNVTTQDANVLQNHGGDDTSYENALSNVARMWEPMHLDRDGPDIGVYIEGMGTTRDQSDSLTGYALGTGETGMTSRAQQAFEPLKNIVADKRGDLGPPAILELNIYAFSRGAATARHFASLLRNPAEIAKHFTDTWSRVSVQVNFVGLFDTVSSEGVAHGNDVDDLGLRFVDDAAQRVFHLMALDEYRENFALTTIASACQAKALVNGARVPMGFELGIPGAHSDVGGGYRSGTSKAEPLEVRDLAPTKPVPTRGGSKTVRGPQAFVYAQGWYGPQDLQASTWHPHRHQRQVQGDYYKVSLSLMVDMAEKYTALAYSDRFKALMQAQTPAVKEVQSALRAYAQDKAFAPGGAQQLSWSLDEHLEPEKAKAFRHAYLHLSFSTRFGMGPRYKNNTELERLHVPG
jgi:hypothetical protein